MTALPLAPVQHLGDKTLSISMPATPSFSSGARRVRSLGKGLDWSKPMLWLA